MSAILYWIECATGGRLAIVPRPRGGDWLQDEILALKAAGIDVLVSLLMPDEAAELGLEREADACAANGIEFINCPVPDRSVPREEVFLATVPSLRERLTKGHTVGIHCRACIGRSAVLAACLVAGDDFPVSEAFELVAKARGCTVPDTREQSAWTAGFIERLRRHS